MVVVDNARKMIGRTIDVVVTSVLQTTAGKMIFGRFIEAGAQQQPAPTANVVSTETDTGRRAKMYSVTASGRRYLDEQRESWERFAGAIAAVLRVT